MRNIIFAIVLLVFGACKRGVTADLDIDPEFVCVPAETELYWEVMAVGRAGIQIEVADTDAPTFLFPNNPYETENQSGTLLMPVPQGETEFRLTAESSGRTATDSERVIGMGSESLSGGFVFEPDCGDAGEVNGWKSVSLSGYDASISPRGITNTSDREIIITHAGTSRPLAPRETSSAWNGTSLNGRWDISARLLSRTRRGAEMVTESCSQTLGPGGSVSPTPGDSTRTIQLEALTAAFTFGCD